jgi:ubiquinone/menaquinone biosynthesis C-methylase UbiE
MFDIESEARLYASKLPYPQTATQIEQFVSDWKTKEEQVEVALKYFDRDVGVDLSGKDVLELGCGAGAMSFALERRGGVVTGIDIDPRALDVARRWGQHRKSNCTFLQCSSEIPLPSAAFDVVYSSSTFEHIAEPEVMLRELARVLRPDGIINLNFPNRLWPIEAHTGLSILPWLPRSLAQRYLSARLPGWNLDSLWFYGIMGFVHTLRRSRASLRLYCAPIPSDGTLKSRIKHTMHALGVPYSSITPGLSLVLKHTNSRQN